MRCFEAVHAPLKTVDALLEAVDALAEALLDLAHVRPQPGEDGDDQGRQTEEAAQFRGHGGSYSGGTAFARSSRARVRIAFSRSVAVPSPTPPSTQRSPAASRCRNTDTFTPSARSWRSRM